MADIEFPSLEDRVNKHGGILTDLLEWRDEAKEQLKVLREDQERLFEHLGNLSTKPDIDAIREDLRAIQQGAMKQVPESVAISLQIHKTIWLVIAGVLSAGTLAVVLIQAIH